VRAFGARTGRGAALLLLEGGADADFVGRVGGVECEEAWWERVARFGGAGAGGSEGLASGFEAAAGLHDGDEEGAALEGLAIETDDVVHVGRALTRPEDLLASGEGGLPAGELETGAAGVGGELVDGVEGGRVRADAEPRADAESVDGGTGGEQICDDVLVEAPAGEDLDVVEAGVVEDAPGLLGEGSEIARIEADGTDLEGAREAVGEATDLADAVEGVVGVDEEDGPGEGVDECLEGGDLLVPEIGMP